MKKLIRLIVPLTIALTLGCSKKDTDPSPQNCEDNTTKFFDSVTAYVLDPTKAKCEAKKQAIRDYVKSCSASLSSGTKKDFDRQLAEACPN